MVSDAIARAGARVVSLAVVSLVLAVGFASHAQAATTVAIGASPVERIPGNTILVSGDNDNNRLSVRESAIERPSSELSMNAFRPFQAQYAFLGAVIAGEAGANARRAWAYFDSTFNNRVMLGISNTQRASLYNTLAAPFQGLGGTLLGTASSAVGTTVASAGENLEAGSTWLIVEDHGSGQLTPIAPCRNVRPSTQGAGGALPDPQVVGCPLLEADGAPAGPLNVLVRGQDGDDQLTAAFGSGARVSKSVYLWGDDGEDVLTGSEGADVLEGSRGSDTIRGNGGNDQLWGSSWENTLVCCLDGTISLGGADYDCEDADTIEGGTGSDLVAGGICEDKLNGGPENDVVAGGFGKDQMQGGGGSDAMLANEADWRDEAFLTAIPPDSMGLRSNFVPMIADAVDQVSCSGGGIYRKSSSDNVSGCSREISSPVRWGAIKGWKPGSSFPW